MNLHLISDDILRGDDDGDDGDYGDDGDDGVKSDDDNEIRRIS